MSLGTAGYLGAIGGDGIFERLRAKELWFTSVSRSLDAHTRTHTHARTEANQVCSVRLGCDATWRLGRWLTFRQCTEGGLNGRPGKAVAI
eukprot:3976972-Amphidinium_carterae.2